jgi:DNA polymerase-1
MKTWLVLDVSYLCHRAWHTMGDLSWKGCATGVVFGFLKSISALKDQFATDNVAFCFESPRLLRKEIYPAYKWKRRAFTNPQEERSYNKLHEQIHLLRTRYLPMIGFKNICYALGYESDDLMAVIAADVEEDVVLVTSDSDMLQCLRKNVSIYSPQKQKIFTRDWFYETYGFAPGDWAEVKAVGGCSTDGVKGVPGVGEATAIKYCQNALSFNSKAYRAIKNASAIIEHNRKLVRLPFEGCPVPVLVEDEISQEGWREVCAELGMRSIIGHPPIAIRARVGK